MVMEAIVFMVVLVILVVMVDVLTRSVVNAVVPIILNFLIR